MRNILILFLTFCLLFSISSQDFLILTEENAPFNFTENGEIKGIAVDILLEAAKRANLAIEQEDILTLPWARAFLETKTRANTMLFSMGRIAERENDFIWVGPIYQLDIGLVAKKSSNISGDSLENLKAYTIGTIYESAPEQLLLAQGGSGFKLDRGSSFENNIRKLINDRVDLIAWNIPSAVYSLKNDFQCESDFDTVYILKSVELYYAFHPESDQTIIDGLQNALDTMKSDGTYYQIIHRYLN